MSNYDITDFQKEVIEASNDVPVLVDFWAPWCGPCRQLGPVLKKLVEEAQGTWKLAKVNSDQNPDLSIQYQVRGIPAVKLFYEGDVVAEFSGALPEHMVRKWLQDNLPEGHGGAGDWQAKVRSLVSEDKIGEARDYLQRKIEDGFHSDELFVRYALLLLPDQAEKSEEVFNQLDNPLKFDMEQEAIEQIAHLKRVINGSDQIHNEAEYSEEVLSQYREAARALLDRNFESALEQFINLIALYRGLDEEGPRKSVLAIFKLLGENHPLTVKYRRRFSMALY
jgi:putative thioredoxin